MKRKRLLRFPQRSRWSRTAGMSLVEVMVAVSILVLFLISLTQFMGNSVNKANQISNNLVARRILDEQISRVLAIRGAFPRVMGPSGSPLTYVACFDGNGKLIPGNAGAAGFVGIDVPEKKWEELSGACPVKGSAISVFEFHVHPVIPDGKSPLVRIQQVKISFFVIKNGRKDQLVSTVLDYPGSI